MLWTWIAIGLMFVGMVAALGYPLLRPLRRGRALPQAPEDLDAWIEEAARARRRRAPAAPRGEVGGTCPRCGALARPSDRFCRQCGTSLARACSRCGTPYDEGDRFCVQCGSPLGRTDR